MLVGLSIIHGAMKTSQTCASKLEKFAGPVIRLLNGGGLSWVQSDLTTASKNRSTKVDCLRKTHDSAKWEPAVATKHNGEIAVPFKQTDSQDVF